MTMTLIETKTLGAAAASIEFTSIPQDATDLVLYYSLRSNRAAFLDVLFIRFNGTSSGYTRRQLRGTGSAAASDTGDTAQFNVYGLNGDTSTSNTFSNGAMYVPNYTSSANKSVSIDDVMETNATEAWQGITAGLWSNTNAIDSVSFTMLFGTAFLAGSTVSLYGITKGSDGIVTTS